MIISITYKHLLSWNSNTFYYYLHRDKIPQLHSHEHYARKEQQDFSRHRSTLYSSFQYYLFTFNVSLCFLDSTSIVPVYILFRLKKVNWLKYEGKRVHTFSRPLAIANILGVLKISLTIVSSKSNGLSTRYNDVCKNG